MMRIQRIRWSRDRVEHVARHGVTPEEVEEVCFSGPLILRGRGGAKRRTYLSFGQSAAGRYLLVVFRLIGGGEATVITAREMDPSERRRYRGQRR